MNEKTVSQKNLELMICIDSGGMRDLFKTIEGRKELSDLSCPPFSNPWYFTPKVNPKYNRVRRISDTHVVKLPGGFDEPLSEETKKERLHDLYKELRVQTLAYNSGLAVPKPEGILEVSIRNFLWFRKNIQGLVMEYIPGLTLEELYKQDRTAFFEASRQRDTEVQKARNLGFTPEDHLCWLNTIWNPEKQKAYLIDLQLWSVRR